MITMVTIVGGNQLRAGGGGEGGGSGRRIRHCIARALMFVLRDEDATRITWTQHSITVVQFDEGIVGLQQQLTLLQDIIFLKYKEEAHNNNNNHESFPEKLTTTNKNWNPKAFKVNRYPPI